MIIQDVFELVPKMNNTLQFIFGENFHLTITIKKINEKTKFSIEISFLFSSKDTWQVL